MTPDMPKRYRSVQIDLTEEVSPTAPGPGPYPANYPGTIALHVDGRRRPCEVVDNQDVPKPEAVHAVQEWLGSSSS